MKHCKRNSCESVLQKSLIHVGQLSSPVVDIVQQFLWHFFNFSIYQYEGPI